MRWKRRHGAMAFLAAFLTAGTVSAAQPTISGTITIDPAFAKEVAGNAVLYITARSATTDGRPGHVLAAKRVAPPIFPLKFTLGASDVMMGGSFQGKVFITARIKKSGMAGPAEPGDLEGTYAKNPAAVGAADVDLVINKRY